MNTTTNNGTTAEEEQFWHKKLKIFESEFYRFRESYENLTEWLVSTNGVLYTADKVNANTSTPVIMKKIWRDRVATFHDAEDGREAPNEIYYHIKAIEASPERVIPILDWFEFEEFFLVVMPKVPESRDLFDLLAREGPLPEHRAKRIFKQLIEVVADLNEAGICHRDIKDENLLIDSRDNLYLIDFGTTMDVDSSYSDQVGTPCFFSPEFYSRGFFRPEQLTVWSCGAVLYMILVRCWRFKDAEWHREPSDEEHLNLEAIKLINLMMEQNPEERATLKQIKQSQWLN